MFRILVFGAGSIGVFLGAKLHAAGHNVVLYGKRKLKSLSDTILINSELYKMPQKIYQLESAEYEAIFVTLKLYHVKKALEQLRRYNFNPQLLAFIQNGLVDESFYEEFTDYLGFVTLSVFNGYNLTDQGYFILIEALIWYWSHSYCSHL